MMQHTPSKLSSKTLTSLPERVAIPRYDRRSVRAGIAHIGVGNFHRAHQALYVDRCLHLAGQEAWGLLGIGLGTGPGPAQKASDLQRQDCLFTLTEYASNGAVAVRVIGSMVDYLHAPADPAAVLDRLADPAIRIVSLTITEGGYNIDEATGEFDLSHPDVEHDLSQPQSPRTAFGFVVEALNRRRTSGVGPFTVMTCDNLRHNGDVAHLAFTSFARARDAGLADWMERHVSFPNSMIDRITPMVDGSERQRLNGENGVDDLRPVMAEDYLQWVMEDRFCAGRPNFEAVGVDLRNDVREFEKVKGRMLNASHMTLCFPALLLGYREVHEAMADKRLRRLLELYMEKDAIPLLTAPAGLDLHGYKQMVLRRFANPAIHDQLLRICGNGAVKLPTFLFKTLATCLNEGRDITRFAFVFACFHHYLKGQDEVGARFIPDEPHISASELEAATVDDPRGVLGLSSFASLDLAGSSAFVGGYMSCVDMIATGGVAKALEAAITTID